MTWNSTCPFGNKPVNYNQTIIQDNMSYVESMMGNSANPTKDHYWNVDVTQDGLHRKVSMKNSGSAPAIPGTFDGVYYVNDSPIAGEPSARFVESTGGDWQLNIWQNVYKGTFITPGSGSSFDLFAVDANTLGFTMVYRTASNLCFPIYWVSDATTCHSMSPVVDDSQFIKPPIFVSGASSSGLFVRGAVPSTYDSLRGQTLNYISFTRSIA